MPSSPTFGGYCFGLKHWGGGVNAAPMFSTNPLVFYDPDDNAFTLSDGTSMILTGLGPIGPSRELIGGATPRDHGEYLTADYFRETIIDARGIMKHSTPEELDAAIDAMKKALRHREGSVDVIDRAGTVKRYTVTVDNYEEMFPRERYHLTICPWRVRFRCKTPFGRARSYTPQAETLITSPSNMTVESVGTIRTLPVILMNFDSATSVTVVNVKRIDPATGDTLEEIEYAGSVAANDLIKFDSEQKTATKNGTPIVYAGSFPILEPGSNILTFTVTGASFSAVTTVKSRPAYL